MNSCIAKKWLKKPDSAERTGTEEFSANVNEAIMYEKVCLLVSVGLLHLIRLHGNWNYFFLGLYSAAFKKLKYLRLWLGRVITQGNVFALDFSKTSLTEVIPVSEKAIFGWTGPSKHIATQAMEPLIRAGQIITTKGGALFFVWWASVDNEKEKRRGKEGLEKRGEDKQQRQK